MGSGTSGNAAAGEVRYNISRVLMEASLVPPPRDAKGYYPAVGISLAAAHRWAPFKVFTSVLRDLIMLNPAAEKPFSYALSIIWRLFNFSHSEPFAAKRRFPAGELYVCVDREPVSSMILRINQVLALDEGVHREYFDVVRAMMGMMTEGDARSLFPVVFDQSVFESVFHLQWCG